MTKKKYEFTGETKEFIGRIVRRIRHIETGVVGGWIEHERNLDQDGICFVYDEAVVCDSASVSEDAVIHNRAIVQHEAQVMGSASVSKYAQVCGHAVVQDSAHLSDRVVVSGQGVVAGKVRLGGSLRISDVVSSQEPVYMNTQREVEEHLQRYYSTDEMVDTQPTEPHTNSDSLMTYPGTSSELMTWPTHVAETPESNAMEDNKMKTQATALSQAALTGIKMGAVQATGDAILNLAQDLGKDIPSLQTLLETQEGKELVKLVFAVGIHSAATHTQYVPKADNVKQVMEAQIAASTMTLSNQYLATLVDHLPKLLKATEKFTESSEVLQKLNQVHARVDTSEEDYAEEVESLSQEMALHVIE